MPLSVPKPKTRKSMDARPPMRRSEADRRNMIAELKTFSGYIASHIEQVPIERLVPKSRRIRVHDERQISALVGAISTFGFHVPLVIDENNKILAGEARLEAARRAGMQTIPCIRAAHMTEEAKRAFAIADNRLAELATWDFPELKIELEFLSDIHFNLDVIGFNTPEIDIVIHAAEDNKAKTGEPEKEGLLPGLPHGPATSKLGDLWQLGKHRLICADATDEAAIARLMEDKQARMILTDVPYNVPIRGFVSGLGKVKHREFAMASGEMDDVAFREFLVKATKTAVAHLVDGGLLYGFIDWRGLPIYHAALTDCRLNQINLAVWNKMTGGMGSLYRSQHELCVIFKYGTAPHTNQVQLGSNGRYRTNVWDHPGMASFGKGRDESLSMHPTVKPVGLLVEAIKDVTDIGDIVVDTFLGSGSTLIAAQKCHRVCFGSELDPVYADTIIRRFETLTGTEAVHIETGLTFAEMTKLRAEEAEAMHGSNQANEPAADADPELERGDPLDNYPRSASGSIANPSEPAPTTRRRSRIAVAKTI